MGDEHNQSEVQAPPLAALMERAQTDPSAFPDFLRALLEATVYAHALPSDDHPRLRLLQFTRPDGLTVLPFFSDEPQACAAAGQDARVLAFSGRTLMEATRGATLMLNPNEVSCTLFPEEIAALLDRDTVADLSQGEVSAGNEPQIAPASGDMTWLTTRVSSVLRGLPKVEAGYLLDARFPQHPDDVVRLVAIGVPKTESERTARAVIVAIQEECARRLCSVDLTTFDPAAGMPAWVDSLGLVPFYRQPR